MKFPSNIPVYGDLSFRGKCPSESAEQITFFNQLPPDLRAVAIHPRNEGKRTAQQAQRHKAEGMTKGAADIIILGAVPFVCELKRQDHTKSRIEPEQVSFLEAAKEAGCFVCVALGWQGAMLALDEWKKAR